MSRPLLFFKQELYGILQSRENALSTDIESYDGNKLLNTSTEDIVAYYVEKYYIDPIELNEDEICVEQRETQIDVRHDPARGIPYRSRPAYVTGTAITFEIPFTGDPKLFQYRPSSFTFNPPFGVVHDDRLLITINTTDHDSNSITQEFNKNLSSIKKYLLATKQDVQGWNSSLEDKARQKINFRKEKLLKGRGLVASLGFKMKKNEDGMSTYAAPEVKRRLPPRTPTASTEPFAPEAILEMGDYEHIIEIMKNTAKMLERSPQAFKEMGEEHLRDQFLVPLNSHYQGQASGETFNFNGKTDILIRVEDRAIFVAECKIWRGQKAFLEAIDQLLGYVTWRDTKVALIVFNRNKDLTAVLDKVEKAIPVHSNYKRGIRKMSETEFRCIFSHRDDLNREMTLTVLVFEVPK